jgi:nickel-dependent lactate racemase
MNIDLHYGQGKITLQIDDANIARIIQPWHNEVQDDNATTLSQALSADTTKNFSTNINAKKLCVLLSDGTRDMPLADIFPQIMPLLKNCAFVNFMICTGTHNAQTPQNEHIIEQIDAHAKKTGLTSYSIHTHDCQADEFSIAGTTSFGTVVEYNKIADNADIFLVLSDVKPHYFAGYSNPIKNFLPGICSYKTAEKNHSLALHPDSTFGKHPWQNNSNRQNNRLAKDQLEGMKLITADRPVYTLAIISANNSIQWAGFGAAKTTAATAFEVADKHNAQTVTPTDYLIVSPGGLPNDIDLYISQRALELTSQAVNNGGEVLFLSQCPAGVGEAKTLENFYNQLTKPIEEIMRSTQGTYKLFSHKPYKFAQLITRLKKIWVYSDIPDETLKAAHLQPTNDPQATINKWITKNPSAKITIVNGANKIALYSNKS